MKQIKAALVIAMAAALCAAAPSSSSGMSGDAEMAAVPLGMSVTIETSLESIYYDANLFGIPLEGTLYPGEPLVINIPFLIYFEAEVVEIDFWYFTLSWHLTFRGVLISEGTSIFGHGDLQIHYNQIMPTPMVWSYDFNAFGLNWPGMVHLWAYSRVPGASGLEHVSATRWTGDTDLSFSFPDFMWVEGTVTEFGASSNTFEYNIYDLYKSYEGVQTFPFGFLTMAYNFASWWP